MGAPTGSTKGKGKGASTTKASDFFAKGDDKFSLKKKSTKGGKGAEEGIAAASTKGSGTKGGGTKGAPSTKGGGLKPVIAVTTKGSGGKGSAPAEAPASTKGGKGSAPPDEETPDDAPEEMLAIPDNPAEADMSDFMKPLMKRNMATLKALLNGKADVNVC